MLCHLNLSGSLVGYSRDIRHVVPKVSKVVYLDFVGVAHICSASVSDPFEIWERGVQGKKKGNKHSDQSLAVSHMHGLFRKSEPDFLVFFFGGGFRCDANVVPPVQSSPFAFPILDWNFLSSFPAFLHIFLLAYYIPVTAYSVFFCSR